MHKNKSYIKFLIENSKAHILFFLHLSSFFAGLEASSFLPPAAPATTLVETATAAAAPPVEWMQAWMNLW